MDLVTFTEEILNGKLYFLCGEYNIIDYGVTMDLQKKSFIEPAGSPDRLKLTLWNDLGRQFQKCSIAI